MKKSGTAGNETYRYDAEGVRRSKTTVRGDERNEIFFVSDTSNELSQTLAETDEKGNILATYSWGDTLLSQTREAKTSTYLYDGHGNVRGLLDDEGKLTDTYAYNAYGELTEKTGETENHFLYTGEYYDGTTNLYYLRARYMNPGTGTFISMDSYQGDLYEPVTLHKYLYANANPVKYSDPSGMFSLAESAAVNAISEVLYENRYTIMGMAILNGIGNGAMTALSGGTLSDVAKSTLEGIAKGATLGIFYCAIAAITVTSLAAVFSAVMAADAIVSIVIAVHNVMDGDYLNALICASYAVVGIIGVCKWYKVTYRVDCTGPKGTVSFTGEGESGTHELPDVEDMKMSQTVQNHMNDVVKKGPNSGQLSRPYIDSEGTTLLLKEIIESAAPTQDVILQSGLRWDVSGSFRGSTGMWELVVDTSTNTIVHFNFVAK